MRSRNAEVDGNFTGGIIGNRSRIMMMIPVFGIVTELRQLINFVFRLDRSVFRNTDVNSDAAFIEQFPRQTARSNRFVRAINSNRSGARPGANFLFGLIIGRIEGTNARQDEPHVTHIDALDACTSFQQMFAEFRQGIPVRRDQTDTRNHNSLRPLHHKIFSNVSMLKNFSENER